jgi:tripartite-type tricarboxylate transporter receptor subunit TctC
MYNIFNLEWNMKRILCTLLAVFVILVFGAVGQVQAGGYPDKPITVIVPFAPGGGTDTQARLLLKFVEEKLGNTMVIVNKPGAGGEIGMNQISNSPADGYTLGVIAYPDSFIRSVYMKTAYKNDDYVYIGTPVDSPVVLIAKPGSPFTDLDSLVKHAKSSKTSLTVGLASDAHYLAAKMFSDLSGVPITPVFFKSGASASNALLGGHVDMQCTNVQFAVVNEASGAKNLAVASDKHVAALPGAKTFLEQGYDVQIKQSRILVAPKNTSKAIVEVLEKAMRSAMESKELQERIAQVGDVFDPLCGQELGAMILATEKRLGPVVQANAKELVTGQQ